ncbi:MAG: M23 family metallopeptidase, partial [Clostridia bacterium]|nr:M23 family metallopeptidase [Clostridia bacterium]
DIAAAIREQYQSVLAREEATDGICIPVSAGSGASQDSGILLTSVTLSGRDAASSALSDTFYNDEEPLMPVNGSVTSDYGYRIHPINGGESFHSGRDIAADEGTDIRAVYDGTVVAVGVGELSGNYVKIDHGDELEALYCHCSAVYVNDGDLIRKGDIIAAVGQTGAATGPHLHFELHRNGEVTDPAELLDQAVNVD